MSGGVAAADQEEKVLYGRMTPELTESFKTCRLPTPWRWSRCKQNEVHVLHRQRHQGLRR